MEIELVIRRAIPWVDLESEQARCVSHIKDRPNEAILLVSEPLPTLTRGLSAVGSDLLWNEKQLEDQGVAVEPVARGGQWTYHGPGQILLYPIVHLEGLGFPRRAIPAFLNAFRSFVGDYLTAQGVAFEAGEKPFGIFARGKKLVSFGLKIHQGIASHGMALYLKPQGNYFNAINPCGVPNAPVISLEEMGQPADWETQAQALAWFVKKGFKKSRKSVGLV